MIGQSLGNYRIVEKIGSGGMGEVYRAHDEKLERDVAVKVLPAGMLADEVARKRFRKEALALAKLNHPNVETIYAFTSHEGIDFLVMEFITGTTLSRKLRSGPLSSHEVLKFSMQIAHGLAAAHEQGVAHCDLKPGNVMVKPNGDVKLLDFGLARFFHVSLDSNTTESLTQTHVAGTLPYMSPEQVRGEGVDFRTDIYATGILLYEMSTGQRPFPQLEAPRLIYSILHQEPARPTEINAQVTPELEKVILKALNKNPDHRYQSVRDLAADLAKLSSASVPALDSPKRKHRLRLFAAASAILVATLAVAAVSVRIVWYGRHTTRPISEIETPIPNGDKHLAILPFAVEGDPASLDYVADGLTEFLYLRLSQINGLNVSSSDTVEHDTASLNLVANETFESLYLQLSQLPGLNLSSRSAVGSALTNVGQWLRKVGTNLGVNVVLSGRVRGMGQFLNVSVDLQNVSAAQPFWSQEFTGETTTLLPLESEIYDRVFSVLGLSESQDQRLRRLTRPAVSEEAYDTYLKGREKMSPRQAAPAPSEAIQFYERSIKKDPNFYLAYIGLADANLVLYKGKKNSLFLQRAVDAARRATQLDDGSFAAHRSLAIAYGAAGKYREATAELTRAVALGPDSDEVYRRLGDAYLQSGDVPAAMQSFQKAVEINPHFWNNQDEIGNVYFQEGDYAKSLDAFRQITALSPNIDAGYENMGNVYLREGKYKECVPYYQKALQIEPYWTTYSNLGTAYFFLKRYSDAAAAYEKAVALNPNDSEVVVNLADAYRWSGEKAEARTMYQHAIGLGYEELRANPRSALTMAQIALSYAKIGNAQQADRFILQARTMSKDDVDYVYDQAEIDAILNRQERALKALRDAFEKHYPVGYAVDDEELENLRKNPQFAALIKQYKPN
jgi:serine/threonine protein kinase/tetratricopeptide (TPR) repeat protein